MPDIIQVADQLKSMPDQWLMQQMQNPSGSAPPWLVASEVARREKLRSGAAQAQAPTSSVSQDLIKSLYAKIPPTAGLMGPSPAAPPGMPPVNLTPGGSSGALGSAPPGAPPANLRMPARPMRKGGSVTDDEEEDYLNPTRDDEMDALYPPDEAETTDDSEEADAMPAAILPNTRPSAFAPPAKPQRNTVPQQDVDRIIEAASKKYRIDPQVLRSLIHTESSNDRTAVSPKQARGLMQVTPIAAEEMGIKDLSQLDDPAVNIDTGAGYLRKQLDTFKELPVALAAYNAGPGAVAKHKGIPPYPETQQYVSKILTEVNGVRGSLKLPPLSEVPSSMRSRLLQGPPEVMGPPEAAPQPAPEPAPAPTPQPTPPPQSGPPIAQAGPPPAGPIPLPLQLRSRLYTPPRPGEGMVAPAAAAAAPPPPMPAPGPMEPPEPAAMGAPPPMPDVANTMQPEMPAPPPPGAPAAPVRPAAPAQQEPLHQSWTPSEDTPVLEGIKKQIADMQAAHVPVMEQQQQLYRKANLDMLDAAAHQFFGAPQDYSKYSKALDTVMAMAEKNMHPSIGDGLMRWGQALMASKEHNFGVAMGQAGLYAQAAMDKLKQEGMRDYMTAAKAGIELQDKANQYTAKIGQYKMQRLGAQQAGVMQDERAYQTHLSQVQREYATAAAKYQATLTPPHEQQLEAVAVLNELRIPIDKKLNDPSMQVARDAPQMIDRVLQAGKAGRGGPGTSTTAATQELRAVSMLAERKDPWRPDQNPADKRYKTATEKLTDKYPTDAGKITVSASVMAPEEYRRAHHIAEGIISGDQPPILTAMYRLSPIVKDILEHEYHYDLSRAALEYTATQQFLRTAAGSPAAIAYQRNLGFLNNSIPIVKERYEKWKQALANTVSPDFLTQFQGYNSRALAASVKLGGDAGNAARQLIAGVNEMQGILPYVYSGGYAPHSEEIERAGKMLSADWNEQDFAGGLDLIGELTRARQNAMKISIPMFVRPNSEYLKNFPGAESYNQDSGGARRPPPLPEGGIGATVGQTYTHPVTGAAIIFMGVKNGQIGWRPAQ
jgi:hypothetical protein